MMSKEISIRLMKPDGAPGEPTISEKLSLSDEAWQKRLTAEEYRVLRAKGTEPAFCGLLTDEKESGVYFCAGCGLPLFSSDAKFHSGTGWPSFFQPFAQENITEKTDMGFGMIRTEILCSRCDSHLGHVFPDGPNPTGLRYCLNSLALKFFPVGLLAQAPKEALADNSSAIESRPEESQTEQAVFAAGCFWGVECDFRKTTGVLDVVVGYTGGHTDYPTYKEVCTDKTGHAEAVLVTYDPKQVSYDNLLDAFWLLHDPTQYNRQGPDYGSQYRSAIFTKDAVQQDLAQKSKEALNASGLFKKPIVTEITPAGSFWPAEEYHQRYFEKHGGGSCHI